jgi:GTPase Era involved in 16S rRNA processing
MCNFNKQNEDTKALIHLFMTKSAKTIGGVNFLLALIEAIKAKKPNALMFAAKQIASENSIIKWNKVIFKDKVSLLEEILHFHKSSQDPNFNILSSESDKKKKAILNMVRTLAPVEFIITPQNHNDGSGFSFKVFETIEDDYVKINPIFVAIFFCSVEYTKKALKYEMV